MNTISFFLVLLVAIFISTQAIAAPLTNRNPRTRKQGRRSLKKRWVTISFLMIKKKILSFWYPMIILHWNFPNNKEPEKIIRLARMKLLEYHQANKKRKPKSVEFPAGGLRQIIVQASQLHRQFPLTSEYTVEIRYVNV